MARAVVLGARRGGVLQPLLVLPLATAVLIFGTATSGTRGLSPEPDLLMLCAVLAAALPVCLLAAGGALRSAAG
jgi:heme exporter protein B